MGDVVASKMMTLRMVRLASALVLLAAAPLLGGCTNLRPKRLLNLETPMYAWHSETASCGRLRVVDGGHRLWTENGCEGTTTGFVLARAVPPAEFAAIAKAFTELPHEVPDCAPGAPAVDIFTSREGSVQKTWRLCANDPKAAVPAEYAAVEAAFGAIIK